MFIFVKQLIHIHRAPKEMKPLREYVLLPASVKASVNYNVLLG